MSSEKKSTGIKAIVGGFIVGGAALFGFLNDGISVLEKAFPKSSPAESSQQQKEITTNIKEFSNSEIDSFIKDYNLASVNALNNKKFSEVKDYLDPTGDMYKKQQGEIEENVIKQTIQKNTKTELEKVKKVNSTTYKVSTYEEYLIYKKNNEETIDQHYHEYTLIVDKNNKLKVSEHTMPKSK
ncbi:hypothetical protein [Bacillus sp. CDB3]|uniref:TcaA NTF2-like domain-containing protein n=1 Tax=Bacillus sp. CDB3 TaxID=360310 RepID=UPI0009D88545|nr:hypothetical protein [Bacillus sp. CDB3]OQR56086.1 hypothetical protein CDB3_15530 [Bacillus sp. CDB3]